MYTVSCATRHVCTCFKGRKADATIRRAAVLQAGHRQKPGVTRDVHVPSWKGHARHSLSKSERGQRIHSPTLGSRQAHTSTPFSLAPPFGRELSIGTSLKPAVIAFGSNLGDRVAHIENALQSMRDNGLRVKAISCLYETKAMYYENQPAFLNGAVVVQTHLSAIELLNLLQRIELEQGRVRDIDKGPRTLDLDIIWFNEETINTERLKVPHPLMYEREFVIRPLTQVSQYYRNSEWNTETISARNLRLGQVYKSLEAFVTDAQSPMLPVTCILPSKPPQTNAMHATAAGLVSKTQVMAIMNITPDSFSDGGELTPHNARGIIQTAKSHIEAGATILDIGGQSTRPGATLITEEDELARVLPALEAVRTIPEVISGDVAVSLDTFYASVARFCIERGLVDIVNDITGGTYDPDILKIVAENKKTIILMHLRGTPQTFTRYTNYQTTGGVLRSVRTELKGMQRAAQFAGIPPWRIILDPGIGFSKSVAGNLELLRRGPKGVALRSISNANDLANHSWLVAPSRKGFIGEITGVKPSGDRSWGTAACVTAAVASGADIVRVHDVKEMVSVVKMADAIYRPNLTSEEQATELGPESTRLSRPATNVMEDTGLRLKGRRFLETSRRP